MFFDFLAGFGWLELTFFAVLFIALVFGTVLDRGGRESPKWYILGVGFIAFCGYYWKDWTFSSAWHMFLTWEFWKPVVEYLVVGLVWSLIEFTLDIRRSAKFYGARWKQHLAQLQTVPVRDEDGNVVQRPRLDGQGHPVMASQPNPNRPSGVRGVVSDEPTSVQVPVMEPVTRQTTIGESYKEVADRGAASAEFNRVLDWSKQFISSYQFRNRIIELGIGEDKISVEPRVNRVELAEHIGAWTFLWPAYVVSLFSGRFLAWVFEVVADFFTHISGRLVRISFKNVFKF